MIQKVTVADSCWMLDSDSGLWPGDLGETEMDFRRTSEDIYKEYIVNGWGIGWDTIQFVEQAVVYSTLPHEYSTLTLGERLLLVMVEWKKGVK